MKIRFLDEFTVVVDYDNKQRYIRNNLGIWTDSQYIQVDYLLQNELESEFEMLKEDWELGEHMKYLGFSNETEYYSHQKWIGDHRGFYKVFKVKLTYDVFLWEISDNSTKIIPEEHKDDNWIRLEFDDEEYRPTFDYFRYEIIEKGILKPDNYL